MLETQLSPSLQTSDMMIQYNRWRSCTDMEWSAKKSLPRLFGHTRLLYMQRKVHRGRQQKQQYRISLNIHDSAACTKKTGRSRQEHNEKSRNDPISLRQMGGKYYLERDYDSSFEYYSKAAELGEWCEFFFILFVSHWTRCCEGQEKGIVSFGSGCHRRSSYREVQSCSEREEKGRFERAVKHWIIAANLDLDMTSQYKC